MPFGRATIFQQSDYLFNDYQRVSQYKENTLTMLVRYHLRGGQPLDVALVGGGVFVFATTRDRYAFRRSFPDGFGPFGQEIRVNDMAIGVTGGLDLIGRATRHISVVPQFRVMAVPAKSMGSWPHTGTYKFDDLGIASVSIRLGIAVRMDF